MRLPSGDHTGRPFDDPSNVTFVVWQYGKIYEQIAKQFEEMAAQDEKAFAAMVAMLSSAALIKHATIKICWTFDSGRLRSCGRGVSRTEMSTSTTTASTGRGRRSASAWTRSPARR